MKTIVTTCLYCNQSFNALAKEVKRGWGKFCCHSCSTNYYARIRAEKLVPNCECANCGKSFYKQLSKLRNSKSGLFFCCRECKDTAQKLGGIKEVTPAHYGNGTSRYRTIAMKVLPNRCNRCGYNSNMLALIVHHIDKDRTNNNISNLEIICANCHMIEHLSR